MPAPTRTIDRGLGQLQRPTRVLIGWLPEDQALHFLAGQQKDVPIIEEWRAKVLKAREAVKRRTERPQSNDVISDVPRSLGAYVTALEKSEAAQVYFKEGWRVMLADLGRVYALQPQVYIDHAEERTANIDPSNLESLASVSLPQPTEAVIPAQYDPSRQAWIITSPNPNLRIVGNWGGQVQPKVTGFGFVVSLLQSFVQVARLQDRFVLRDGYHRALGFLQRGIARVPVFFREYEPYADLGIGPGLLPPNIYLGTGAPVLTDYLDDSVSALVSLPAFQKMIVIHGLELTPFG